MATNIKIVGNILNISTITRYSEEDINLISSKRKSELFGGKDDYIEYFIFDAEGNVLNTNYNYLEYKLPSSSFLNPSVSSIPNTTGQIQTTDVGISSILIPSTSSLYPVIEIDPVQDLQNLGYTSGEFNVRYNFFEKKISDFLNQELFVKEISRDRTEIRLGSVTLTNEQIESGSLSLINEINNTEDYYVDYILNFGDNQQYVAVNVALNKEPEGYEILFKLYNPLPLDIQEKQTLWVVEEKTIPYIFNINLDRLITPPPPPSLRGPNFNIDIEGQGTVSTIYTNYSNLIYNLQLLQSSSYNKIQNLLATQSIDINVDYTNFSNFVFFGSSYQRINNFYNKVKEIENYQNFISTYTPFVSTTASLQTTINQYSSSINNIISQFDGYEYYLYFESSSYTWPKSGSIKPFSLLSTGSNAVITWYNNLTGSALDYDLLNYNNLEYAVPTFVKDDSDNQPFLLFLNMIGHYFDNIWIYIKAVTDINLANNNLDYGISRDLVYQQLKSLGIKLYNSQAGDNVADYLVGANSGSTIWNNDFSITSSYLNNIPRKDLVAELYKRIYHNLPLLLKTKGTVAGLNNLMTVFGIPNRNYYVIKSESFYTPTGSAFTSSILNVKEFGGSSKSELIKGYNNDKVRIVDNTIEGNVLSPLLSLQTYPTASSNFRNNDLQYIDISFSPQTQINTYISGAISSNNPTWSIDDYIGDPNQLYNGSYPDLDLQRKLYFETGVPGFNPFTSSLLDYNEFIRLIEFFDNSLFKMLNDFVPERTSLSTGVTISSPVLERNKAAYSKPTVTTQSIYEADYDVVNISSQYGVFYNALSASNNTKAWYDGNISGSTVNINQYFEDNYNPYLLPSSSININNFAHSDWNTLLNNVSKSVESNIRKKIEYVYGTTGSIIYPAELQDSYLTLKSYNNSRYDGSKITSLLYNTYTSASYTGSDGITIQLGDNSFGKTAVIDHNVRKIGLFTQIETSSFLPNRNNVSIKYLVDELGGLTELNQLNKHWEEVQNTFVVGDHTTVTLFDNRKYSNQKTTDGNKLIFDSGYAYYPVLYFSGSCPNNLYFENIRNPSSFLVTANNLSSSYFISGSSVLGYPVSGGIGGAIMNLFNNEITDTNNIYTPGSPATYSVAETGQYRVYANVDVTLSYSASLNSTWSLQIYSGSTIFASSSQNINLVNIVSSSTYYGGDLLYYIGYSDNQGNQKSIAPVASVLSTKEIALVNNIGTISYPTNTLFYEYILPFSAGTTYNCAVGAGNEIGGQLLYSISPSLNGNRLCGPDDDPSYPEYIYDFGNEYLYEIPNFNASAGQTSQTFTIDRGYSNENYLSFNNGQILNTRLVLQNINSSIYTASISQGSLIISALSQTTGYSNITCASNNRFLAGQSGSYVFTFNNQLSSFYDNGYLFVPNPLTGSINSLYSVYGDVDYEFNLNTFSILLIQLSDNTYVEYRIVNINNNGTNVSFTVDKIISNQVSAELSSGAVKRVLLLVRIKDETNAYIVYQKRPGQTSYGFIIPQDLATDVLTNIDIITKEVKQKLLADQQGLTQ